MKPEAPVNATTPIFLFGNSVFQTKAQHNAESEADNSEIFCSLGGP